MPGMPASLYTKRRRRPLAGMLAPEEDVLELLAQEVARRRPAQAVALGGGLAAAVIARAQAQAGGGQLTVLEDDVRRLALTRELLDRAGATARLIEAGLEDYDDHNFWYPVHRLGHLPDVIDLLFIDGPGHFAGRMPRWPAGPELFPRLGPSGIVVLDDGRRVKEKKALARWAGDFPEFEQIGTKTSGGAVILRRR